MLLNLFLSLLIDTFEGTRKAKSEKAKIQRRQAKKPPQENETDDIELPDITDSVGSDDIELPDITNSADNTTVESDQDTEYNENKEVLPPLEVEDSTNQSVVSEICH